MQNLRSERPPRGLAISRKAWKRESPTRLPCKHPRLSGMDLPCPIRCVPAPWAAYATECRAFPCDKAQRPALSANVGPDIDKSDGAQPSRQRVRRIRPHPVHYGAPPGIPGLLVHDQKHAGRSEYAEHLGKGGGYIRPEVDRLESGDEIEGRIGIGQPGNVPCRTSQRPAATAPAFFRRLVATLSAEKSIPQTDPCGQSFRNCARFAPPPHPISSTRASGSGGHMRPTPLRQRSVPPVHSPQHDPSG